MSMRTTLTLDDDVAARLRAEARRSGRPFRIVVNEHLRAALAQRKTLHALAPFRVEPRNLGGPMPGLSYDNIGALLDEVEGARRR
jgi:Ribbon-helix-helix protein, copG family